MDKLSKFATLSGRDRWFLLACIGVVLVVRLGLTLTSYRLVSRWLVSRSAYDVADASELARISLLVPIAARRIPHATCLTQALAGKILLGWRGKRSTIRIGVRPDGEGGLDAHAWLLSGEAIVLGGTLRSLGRYAQLVDLETAR